MDLKTRKTFKFIFITLFVDLLAFTLILPLLPKILDYYASYDNSGFYRLFNQNLKVFQDIIGVPESHNQVLLAGILGSWFSFLQFASSPFFGALSDNYGRKPILMLAMSGSILSYISWFLSSNSFALFILSRTIGGLCKANVGLSLAIVSDVSNDNTRGKGMAVVGSSFSLAFIFGPLLGAYLSTLAKGEELQNQLILNPSLIAIILSIIDLMLVYIFIEETNPINYIEKNRHVCNSSKSSNETALLKAFHFINPKSLFNFSLVTQKTKKEAYILHKSGLIYFYYLLFYSGLEFTLSFLTHIRFGFSSMDQGKLYLFSGLLMAIIQGGYIRRMKGGKESLMALIGLITIIPSFIFMGLSSSVNQIYLSLSLYSFSSAVVVPCLTTIVSSHSPSNTRGVIMGTFRSIGALARAMGPCIASLMFWTVGPMLCYICGALALILPLYLMKNLYLSLKQEANMTLKKDINNTKKSVAFREVAKAN